MREINSWFINALSDITKYNAQIEQYNNTEFKNKQIQCINAIFNKDIKRIQSRFTILCFILEYNIYKTQKNQNCYVFNCQSGKHQFSIIAWRVDPSCTQFLDKKIKVREPVIFHGVQFKELGLKVYIQADNKVYFIHNWCDELKKIFKKGDCENNKEIAKNVNILYLWMYGNENAIEDNRFYKTICLEEFKTYDKATECARILATKSTNQKGRCILLICTKNITMISNENSITSTLKHWCNLCRQVYEDIIPPCSHITIANPWLEIGLTIQFVEKFGKKINLNIIVLLSAIKKMYEYCVSNNIKINHWDSCSTFILNTFENKQIFGSMSESRYFIPIVYAFFNETMKQKVMIKVRVDVSKDWVNYSVIDIIESANKINMNDIKKNDHNTALSSTNDTEIKDTEEEKENVQMEPVNKKRKLQH